MNSPLYNAIAALTGSYPLHMPGHKRNTALMPQNIINMDITEIEGSDNLHAPKGVIMQAQQLMAELYGCGSSIFCVNGGSSGILAAVLAVCGEGDTLLAFRNAHKSLQNALILSGASAVYLDSGTSCGFSLPADPDMIESYLQKDPGIKAVFVVSPTYEGFCADIKKISETVHRYGKVLIVDETHGAHFPFNKAFPENAMRLGADISIESWHKTLPLPNQCAVLNIAPERLDIKRIMQTFSMVTTTSPSYIFMGLMDYFRAYYTAQPAVFEEYAKMLKELRARINTAKHFALADSIVKNGCTADFDISKLTVIKNCAESTDEIADILKTKYGFTLEATGSEHLIAMTSPADDPEMLDRFVSALLETDKQLTDSEAAHSFTSPLPPSEKIVQRKIFYSQKKAVDLSEAVGKTAADFVTPFPPDIPLIMAGEVITSAHISALKRLMDTKAEIIGLDDNKIYIINTP